MPNPPAVEADLRAIEALNEQDMQAIMANDIATITSQWTEGFVVVPAAGRIVRGRAANVELAERGRDQLRTIEPVEYVARFDEIKVVGDYAYERGTYRGSMRPRAGGEVVSYSGKLMRIFQRQQDGSWKMHRTMLTTDPPATDAHR